MSDFLGGLVAVPVLLFDLKEVMGSGIGNGCGIGCGVVQGVSGDNGPFERALPVEPAGDGLFAFAFVLIGL